MCSSEDFTDLPQIDRTSAAISLPIVVTYNMRGLLPKVPFKADLFERNIDIGFLKEIWEDIGNENYQLEVEKMFQINGLKYISLPRPKTSRCAYGGAAVIVNTLKFSFSPVNIKIPEDLEVV